MKLRNYAVYVFNKHALADFKDDIKHLHYTTINNHYNNNQFIFIFNLVSDEEVQELKNILYHYNNNELRLFQEIVY